MAPSVAPTLFGQLAGAAQSVAQQAVGGAVDLGPPPPPPPPPKVWCLVLRRKPIRSPEDEPEIGDCEKLCLKLLLIPFAIVTYFLGWIISLVIYAIGCCCCPLCGPAIFTAFATTRMQSASEFGAGHAAASTKQDAARAAGGLTCLVHFYKWVYWNLIRPLGMLCDW
ncbi:unnamed protein product [Polarella glacialis]|uniref:Uncharacterized protein n=1 Tax=Polarella glacialis TaxID=89957 RepID=A0A813JR45_POLGL|nr:unnamed protein product [Polarella glacialis]|mmetsp:Transcript_61397/g.99423  ORF Transcript_61397/g.99423 Transcript_61397/m.99423 type:complete len:167 (+) Transcript_61397:89-589(+)